MHLALGTTVLLLLVLMDHLDPAAGGIAEFCKRVNLKKCPRWFGHRWYQLGNNRCVFVFNAAKKFQDAEWACRRFRYGRRKGNMVSVHSWREDHQVLCATFASSYRRRKYWIGLARRWGRYKIWTNRSTANFFAWSWGQPDNSWGKEGCVEINYGWWGRWNDASCWHRQPFVCELRYR